MEPLDIEDTCVLCKKGFVEENPVSVREKGLRTLARVSKEKDQEDLFQYVFAFFFSSRSI